MARCETAAVGLDVEIRFVLIALMTRGYDIGQVVIGGKLTPSRPIEAVLHIAEPDEWRNVIAGPLRSSQTSATVTAMTVCAFEYLDTGDSHCAPATRQAGIFPCTP